MPYIPPWDADSSKNKKTYEGLLRITDDPTKVITLQLMELLPNVEKVLILGGRAWNFFGDMIPELVSQDGPITHPMNWFMGRVREKQQERAMTVIPGIISGSTIPSQDTWNEYIKVTANMTEKAIKLRCKKQHHQKMINHYAVKVMREMLGSKDDLSEEMIENMGMEEMLSNLEGDYKIETFQIKRASRQEIYAARYASMTEEEKASRQKRDAARYASMTEEEKASRQEIYAARYASMTEEEKASKRKRDAARKTASNAAMTEEQKASKRKKQRKKCAEKTAEEKENTNAQRRKKRSEKTAEEKEKINAQRQKKRSEKTAALELVSEAV